MADVPQQLNRITATRDWDAPIPLANVNYSAPLNQLCIPYLEDKKAAGECFFSSPYRGSQSNETTMFYAVRWFPSLSRTFIELKFPIGTRNGAKYRQKNFQGPRHYSNEELQEFSKTYGPRIVEFCLKSLQDGRRVGNGSCYAFAESALTEVAKSEASNSAPVMISIRYSHGQPIFYLSCEFLEGYSLQVAANPHSKSKENQRVGDINSIRPGDIVQYESTVFFMKDEYDDVTKITFAPNPNDEGKDHTAYWPQRMPLTVSVITSIISPGVFKVIQQTNGTITEDDLVPEYLSHGKIWIYRPIPITGVWPDHDTSQSQPASWPNQLAENYKEV
jgi:hypothetical protein